MLNIDTLELRQADLNELAASAIVLAQSGRISLQSLAETFDVLNQYEKDAEDRNAV